MYFIDEIWKEIKTYLFHRHLWYFNMSKKFQKQIKYNGYNSRAKVYVEVALKCEDKFIKMVEITQFGIMETYSLIPKHLDNEEIQDYIYRFRE